MYGTTKKWISAFVVVAMVFALALAGCSNGTSSSAPPAANTQPSQGNQGANDNEPKEQEYGELRLGLSIPVTGANAFGGSVLNNAVKLAVDEINDAGGIDGKWKIKLFIEDNENEPAKAVSCAEKLVNQDKVHVLISGTNSSCVLADMKITMEAGVPEITPSASAVSITQQGNPYIFRTAPIDAINVQTLFKYLTEEVGGKDIVVLYRTDDYGMGGYDLIQQYAPQYGVNIMMAETFNATDRDYSVQLTKFKDSGADALFLWGQFEEAALIAKQMRQYGVGLPFMGTGYNSPKLIELGGEDVEGVICAASFCDTNPDPRAQEFDQKYKSKFNGAAYDQNAPQSYDTVYIIAEAVRRAGELDSQKIRDEIAKTQNFHGISGMMSFDEHGEVIKDLLVIHVNNGRWEVLHP